MRSHPSQRVAFVPTNSAAVSFDAAVRFHVSLSGAGGRTDDVATRTLPAGHSASRRALVARFGDSSTFPASSYVQLPAFQTVIGLMGVQVVQRREFNSARQTNQLLVLAGWAGSTGASGTHRRTGRILGSFVVVQTRRTVVFLVNDVIFVFAKHDVAFFAFGDALFDENLRSGVW